MMILSESCDRLFDIFLTTQICIFVFFHLTTRVSSCRRLTQILLVAMDPDDTTATSLKRKRPNSTATTEWTGGGGDDRAATTTAAATATTTNQDETNDTDNAEDVDREEDVGSDIDYEEEPCKEFVEYIEKNYGKDNQYGKNTSPEELGALKRKLVKEAWEYWERFKKTTRHYNLRWHIKFSVLFDLWINGEEVEQSYFTTIKGVKVSDWFYCPPLIQSDNEMMNKTEGFYMALDPRRDPNLTLDLAPAKEKMQANFPQHGMCDEELEAFVKELFHASFNSTGHIDDINAKIICKVGFIHEQELYKRFRNLLQFNSQHNKVVIKFLPTKNLCTDRLKILEVLVKLSLYALRRYSGYGEVYYANRTLCNQLFHQAKIYVESGRFRFKIPGTADVTASGYKSHPMYQEYLSETNRNRSRSQAS